MVLSNFCLWIGVIYSFYSIKFINHQKTTWHDSIAVFIFKKCDTCHCTLILVWLVIQYVSIHFDLILLQLQCIFMYIMKQKYRNKKGKVQKIYSNRPSWNKAFQPYLCSLQEGLHSLCAGKCNHYATCIHYFSFIFSFLSFFKLYIFIFYPVLSFNYLSVKYTNN